MKKRMIFEISLWKTIRFNVHYFGFSSFFNPRVLVARNVKLIKMGGVVLMPKYKATPDRKISHFGFSTNPQYEGKKLITTFYNEGKIIFDGYDILSRGDTIYCKKEGMIHLGYHVHLSQNVFLECEKEINIGSRSIIGFDTLIMDSDNHRLFAEESPNNIINLPSSVNIGEHCWIGCRCTILKGAHIFSNNVVASGAIITSHGNETAYVVLGSNCKILKSHIIWNV